MIMLLLDAAIQFSGPRVTEAGTSANFDGLGMRASVEGLVSSPRGAA